MKVFLTGATGFVGLNILAQLTEQGHEVHVYVRPSSDLKYVEGFGATVHTGELSDVQAMTAAMAGMDAVIHTAGNTSCFWRDYDLLRQVNVVGTRNIVDAVLANGIKRLVYTSTTSTIGASEGKAQMADESTRLVGFRAKSPYGITKIEAEKEVLRAHNAGVNAIILNPAEVIGAFDHNFQWGRLVMAVQHNQVPFIPPGGASFCWAKDVAQAHVAALTAGRSGERYILAGDDRDYVVMFDIIADKLGKGFDEPNKNYTLLYLREWFKEKLYPLLGKDYLVEPYRIRVFGGHYYFASDKAQQDLGYRVSKLEDMFADAVDWYRKNGIVPAANA